MNRITASSALRRSVLLGTVAILAAGLVGCDSVRDRMRSRPRRFVFVLVDTSSSIDSADWATVYGPTWRGLVGGLAPGDRVVAAEAHGQTLTDFRPVVDREIEETGNSLEDDALAAAALPELAAALDPLGGRKDPAVHTELLDGLQVAAQHFAADPRRPERWLVFLSDMLEDSSVARFDQGRLDSEERAALISRRAAEGAIPDLGGVQVMVAGAGGRDADRYREMEAFWREYLARAGACIGDGAYSSGAHLRLVRATECASP